MTVKTALIEFARDESAQDLVEYALLGVFVGVAGALVWQNIASLIGERYAEYNTNVNSLWASPEFGS